MRYRFNHMNPNMYFNWMIPLLIIIIIGVAIYMIVKNNNKSSHSKNTAIDILDQRFANGEIDEEEYLKRKKHLKD